MLGDYVFLFLVQSLAWEERVFVYVTCDLAKHGFSQFIDESQSLFAHFEVG